MYLALVALLAVAVPSPSGEDTAATPAPTEPAGKHEILYSRNLFHFMGADAFRPESIMTLPDRSWMALEYRWETPNDDPDPAKNRGLAVHMMTGMRYERFRLREELVTGDRVRSADTGIHSLSWRRYFFVGFGNGLVQFGSGANFGLAWEFSTYTDRNGDGLYTDVRRINRQMAYVGMPFYMNWHPNEHLVFTGEAALSGFATTTTITPLVRLTCGAGIRF